MRKENGMGEMKQPGGTLRTDRQSVRRLCFMWIMHPYRPHPPLVVREAASALSYQKAYLEGAGKSALYSHRILYSSFLPFIEAMRFLKSTDLFEERYLFFAS